MITRIILSLSFSFVCAVKRWRESDYYDIAMKLKQGMDKKIFPGAVAAVYQKDYIAPIILSGGNYEYPGDPLDNWPINDDSIFDMASVSKVVGATSAAMLLWQRGQLNIDASVVSFLPDFGQNGKEKVTVRNLLLHNSGLAPDAPLFGQLWSKQMVIQWLYQSQLDYPIGTKTVYSDLKKISGLSLDQFLAKEVWGPIGMKNTFFNPPEKIKPLTVPTENDTTVRKRLIWGEVHDPTAYAFDGVCGDAGVFSTAEDMLKFMKTMLYQGDNNIFTLETLHYWTKLANVPYQNSRALGWDTVPIQTYPPCGFLFSPDSFGHTGYTGTSVWADWQKDLIIVLLTNRVYPDDKASIVQFRAEFSDLVVRLLQ